MAVLSDEKSFMNGKTKREGGFTYVEVLIALVVLSLFAAPLLIMFPAGSKEGQLATLYTRATNLAQDMMEEIKGKAFEDPNEAPRWGPELPGEDARIKYDDVDDYDGSDSSGWVRTPPEDMDGNDLDGNGGRPDFTGFTRKVEVWYADYDAVGEQWVIYDDTNIKDYKMIKVTVSHDDMAPVKLVTIVAKY